jgi:hypothetical protein
MKQYFQKIDKLNLLTEPNYLSDNAKDILNDKPKQLVALDKLIEEFEKNEQKINQTIINKDLSGVKIPKMNPLMSMPKVFNKFDMVPGNMINPFPNFDKPLNEEKK